MMLRSKGKLLLMIVALLVAPLAGIALVLYSAGQIAVRRRRVAAADPYLEWLALRDSARPRATASEAAPRRPAKRQ